jgi:hypothetical protein
MKRIVLAVLVVGLLASAAPVQAQFFGQLAPLTPRAPSGLETLGASIGFATKTFGVTGELRIGLGQKLDMGIQTGFTKISDGGPTVFGGRADVKVALVQPVRSAPGFAIGGQVTAQMNHSGPAFEGLDGTTLFALTAVPGMSLAGSVGGDMVLSGWGGFGFAFMASKGETSTSAVLRLGSGFDFSPNFGTVAEYNHSFAGDGADQFQVGFEFFPGGHGHKSSHKAAPAARTRKGR